jgi:hypothetical protein
MLLMGVIKVLVGGDVSPMGKVQEAFIGGRAEEIFHDLTGEINSADLSIVTLECPLVSLRSPIPKPGSILGAEVGCVQGFVTAGWDVVNLANNHSLDHGTRGLLETIRVIKQGGLSVVGAGENLEDAQAPFVKEINGTRIVVYSMAEQEFSIAHEDTPGANPLDLINFVRSVRKYKRDGVFIVLVHGGKEYCPYPSPEMVRRCRFIIEMGADAVICSHTHCSVPWEMHSGRPIVYGLGNLVFEPLRKEPPEWYQGYIAKLNLEPGRVSFEAVPYMQSLNTHGAHRMDEAACKRFHAEMKIKCTHLKDSRFLKERWVDFCLREKETYLAGLFGYNRLMLKAMSPLLKTLHSKKDILRALLLAQCETHQEILKTILRNETGGW